MKWQEKVLPSAVSFADALYQARAAEEQEKQLSAMHPIVGKKGLRRHQASQPGETTGQPRRISQLLVEEPVPGT